MRKLLLFFAILLTAVVVNAKPINWSADGFSVTGGDDGQKQTLSVSGPGAFAAFVAATKDLPGGPGNEPLQDLGKDANRSSLVITGTLNAADLAALNSTVSGCGNLANFKTIDLSDATISLEEGETLSGAGMNMAGLEYLRLPNSMTSADDVKEMGKLKQNGNANLKMVGAYDPDNDNYDGDGKWAEVALYSYEADNVVPFITQMNMPSSGNPTIVPREIRMAGEYGEKDLVSNGATGTPNFGYGTSAEWDFTGAHFADITISQSQAKYYNFDDPFCENGLVAPSTSSNAFYYFKQYSKDVVDLKLPDKNMTHLPMDFLYEMAKQNESGYKALYGEAAFNANRETNEGVPIETFVIPKCYTDIDQGCAEKARIRHLIVGKGVKRIHGGAFLNCPYLEDLDFASGISDCYIGDRAFNQCESMKHIALSEGIVSIGNGGFWNSQHLESIRLPQSLLYIGNDAFNNCLALNSITIPENVQKIGQRAFTLCPFTDIYLTTTDPAKIPLIWSAGISEVNNGFGNYDTNSTFYHMHLDGWDGIPDTPQKAMLEEMTWDEAAEYYYTHVNGIPVFHFNKQLADAVRAQISSTYAAHTKADTDGKTYGLPLRSDMYKRSNVEGADLGGIGEGKYTRDGWAQFMLMKEFSTDPGSDVYQKEFEDVWYTICYPFDLTDEQLAAAFNENFNIVDFSGVEIINKEDSEDGNQKLILHFNNVAKTYYRDNKGNEYEVIGREVDPTSKFSYNIYKYTDPETGSTTVYHHSQVSSFLSSNKTKTFAPGNSIDESNANKDQAIIIDGYLATAGHPYMIHPAFGTSIGNPQKCAFSGIDWKPMTQWPEIFEAQKRTVDLGVAKTEDNFNQAAYSKYAGQTYTFIGNAKEYRDDAQGAIGNEPQVPEKPIEPVAPTQPETLSEPTGPIDPPTALTADEQELVSLLTDGQNEYNRGPWYGITEAIGEDVAYNDGSDVANRYNQQFHIISGKIQQLGYNVYNGDAEAAFEYCKTTFNKSINYASNYAAYLANQAEWAAYNANQEAWSRYNAWQADDGASEKAAYQTALDEYNRLARAHESWVENAKKWKTYIPKNAYFLGRKGTALPKYYREVAENPAEGQASTRKGGVWTQFTAIVIPNDAAVAGVESELDGKTASSKGFDMAFDEDFLGEFIEQDDVVTLIEKAQEEGAKVEYMDIVVSINGQVVRRGTTSLEGLPRGMYIINGKKYFVK